jgi:hypothetical protein
MCDPVPDELTWHRTLWSCAVRVCVCYAWLLYKQLPRHTPALLGFTRPVCLFVRAAKRLINQCIHLVCTCRGRVSALITRMCACVRDCVRVLAVCWLHLRCARADGCCLLVRGGPKPRRGTTLLRAHMH